MDATLRALEGPIASATPHLSNVASRLSPRQRP